MTYITMGHFLLYGVFRTLRKAISEQRGRQLEAG